MKNHKIWMRLVAIVLVVMLLLTSILTFGARAQGNLSIRGSASPNAISEPDTVEITITLENDSAFAMHAVTITGNSVSEDVGGLSPGESTKVSFSYSVNEYELTDGVPITVEWVENEEVNSGSTTVSIEKKQKSEPKILLKREIDKTDVQVGDQVTLTYTVTNTGDVGLRSIVVEDPGVSDEQLEDSFRLAAGESKKITKKVTVEAEGFTSKPSVSAKDSDGQRTSDSVSAQIVTGEEELAPKITMVATPSARTEEGIPILVTVKNEGNVAIEKITIRDDAGVILADGETIEANQTKEFQTLADGTQERQVIVTLTGQPVGEETPITLSSTPIAITPEYESDDLQVVVEVIPKTSSMDEAGDLPVQVILNNTSGLTLRSVTLNEAVRGKLKSLEDLPPGITKIDDLVVSVLDSGALQFFVEGHNPVGESLKFDAAPVNITVYNPATVSALETEEIAETDTKETNSAMWLIAMLVLIVLLVALIVALIVVLVKEKRLKRLAREEEEYEQIEEMIEEVESPVIRRPARQRPVHEVEDDLDLPDLPKQSKQPQTKAKPQAKQTQTRSSRSPIQAKKDNRKIVVNNERKRVLDLTMGEEPEVRNPDEGDQLHLMEQKKTVQTSRPQQQTRRRPVAPTKQTGATQQSAKRPASTQEKTETVSQKQREEVVQPTTNHSTPQTSKKINEEDLFAAEFLGEEANIEETEEDLFAAEFLGEESAEETEERLFEQAFLSDDDEKE